ncbi:3-oxoacyl-[acyl-carrier-protein] synthase 2 [Novipirellula aureliae]|uniref:3-oxoacyl-[acyl-carrier-protein] synthase 2 n=1 Tax=Novipirellula aureliae TaxID=2527966 RepID=A0A5C6DXE7_9BACT|nr:beta-ketoacyl synthase N-terminal-like domain-containing protein [Novipirellula aureliae]TWU41328.1 3-oxoacyl-[acyl-carrier-protein] synthase 2 [Novipirellula aureliae]
MPEVKIVITGAGVVSPIGLGHADFFESLLHDRSGVRLLSERDDDGPKPPPDFDRTNGSGGEFDGVWVGAPVIGFEPKEFVTPRKAIKVMCREIQLTFAAAMMAVENADLADDLPARDDGRIHPSEIGTVFGSEMFYGPPTELADAFQLCLNDDGQMDESQFGEAAMKKIMPLWMLKYLPNMPACHIGIAINAHGPNNSILLGDTSGSAALIEAMSCIERGAAKWMLTGGTGTRINGTRMNYRSDFPVASIANPVSQSSRPYDVDSRGVVGGEAAVAFLVESKETAIARGAKPLAEVVCSVSRFVASGGMSLIKRSSENRPLTAEEQQSTTTPATPAIRGSAAAISLAIKDCLSKSKMDVKQIGLVVGHAMGDPIIDEQERIAVTETLPGVPIVVPIEKVGHTGAASGSIELLVGVLALSRGVIPPSLRLANVSESPNRPAFQRQASRSLEKDYAICISHAPEGGAVATLLKRMDH